MQPTLDRIHGHAERSGSFGCGEPLDVAEQDHLAVLLRQRVERTRERESELSIGRTVFGARRKIARLGRVLIDGVRLVLQPSTTAHARASREREYPTPER